MVYKLIYHDLQPIKTQELQIIYHGYFLVGVETMKKCGGFDADRLGV